MLVLALLLAAAPDDLHQRILVLDTHLDTPAVIARPGFDVAKRHTWRELSQVDLPRMSEGGLDGGFFVVYTEQGPLTKQGYADARDHALRRLSLIRETVAAHADTMELALTAEDARRIAAAGKRVVFISVENSYPIGEDLTLVDTFAKLGVRMAGIVHSKNNQLADSATDEPKWRGLSPLGKKWVTAMNRAGLVIDASHASDETLKQLMALSKTPVVLSHSGSKVVFDHPRNIDDALLKKVASTGGVMQVNSLYLAAFNDSPELGALMPRIGRLDEMSADEQAALLKDFAALPPEKAMLTPGASFDTFMKSLLHAIEVAGIDHVGVGADWDGGGGVPGLEDVAALPKVTAALVAAGYSEADIAKIWSGNILRAVDGAAAYARSSASDTKPASK